MTTQIKIDYSRDERLSEVSLATLKDRYLLEGEKPQDAFARAALAYASNPDHAQRIYDYVSKGWMMFSTPILTNGGTKRGLPISCFLGYVDDSRAGLADHYVENIWLSSMGGGIGGYWGHLRSDGTRTSSGSMSTGVIPFIGVVDRQVLAFSQGVSRRGSYAAYMDISHPEIEEFVNIRKPSGGDVNRKSTNIHNAVVISDEFMRKVTGEDVDVMFNLIDPKTKQVTKQVNARQLWMTILELRVETGEPYIMFGDTVNNLRPQELINTNTLIHQSNLCVAPETKILTSNGWETISSLEGKEVKVWTGGTWSKVTILKTGTNQELLRVTFSNGTSLDCTPYHKFYVQNSYGREAIEVRAGELATGDKLAKWDLPIVPFNEKLDVTEDEFKYWYSQGFYSGDGNTNLPHSWLYSTKYMCQPYLVGTIGDIHTSSSRRTWTHGSMLAKDYLPHSEPTRYKLAWLAGYLDADGSVIKSTHADTIQVASVNHKFLHELMLMLATMGVYSTIGLARVEGSYELPGGKGGVANYDCQDIHRLCISTKGTAELLSLGLSCKRLRFREVQDAQRSATRQVQVVKVEHTGRISDTYCANEPLENRLMFNGIQTGNCSEITLPTGPSRTAVCCLSSLNLEMWDEWKSSSIVEDLTEFLDNVLESFITEAPDSMHSAITGADLGRDIGIGAMGWHSYLQSKGISFESPIAIGQLRLMHKTIKERAVAKSEELGKLRGVAPDVQDGETTSTRRNTHLIAIAPNASSGIICGTSPSIEPIVANIFTQKTLSGSFTVKNKYLRKLLLEKGLDTDDTWKSIRDAGGSVQHLDFLTDEEKQVFKTAGEIDQHWLIEQNSHRQQFVDQAISLNLFFPPDADGTIDAAYLHSVHVSAWKKGVKTLYYVRSKGIRRAENIGSKVERVKLNTDECIACEG